MRMESLLISNCGARGDSIRDFVLPQLMHAGDLLHLFKPKGWRFCPVKRGARSARAVTICRRARLRPHAIFLQM
jgi:hypothetical protein